MKRPDTYYWEFLLRRLHSLLGLLPMTLFLFFHLYVNGYSIQGPEALNEKAAMLRSLPHLRFLEWGLLFTPFLFHMVYGFYIIFTGRPNPLRQPYERNWAYLLQRITAVIAFVFILQHVISLSILDRAMDETTGHADFYGYMRGHLSDPYVWWWYVLGVGACAYHLANGVVTFCMTWGITVGEFSQRAAKLAMAGAGIVLFALGIAALQGFVSEPVAGHVGGARETTAMVLPADAAAPADR